MSTISNSLGQMTVAAQRQMIDAWISSNRVADQTEEELKFKKIPFPALDRALPLDIVLKVAHPFFTTQWQRTADAAEVELAWKAHCNFEFPSIQVSPGSTWEAEYFKEKIKNSLLTSGFDFTQIKPEDLALFYFNRDRITSLNLNLAASLSNYSRRLQLTDRQVCSLTALFPQLKSLTLGTVSDLKTILKAHGKNLERLTVTTSIEGLKAIRDYCTKLVSLEVTVTGKENSSICRDISTKNPALKGFNPHFFPPMDAPILTGASDRLHDFWG